MFLPAATDQAARKDESMIETTRTAEQIAASLKSTAQKYHDGAIDHATLSIRNERDWREAETMTAADFETVRAILRG